MYLQYLSVLDHVQTSSKSFQRRNKSSSALDFRPSSTKLEPLVTESVEGKTKGNHSVRTGNLDDKIKSILDSVAEKSKADTPTKEICQELKTIPRHSKEKFNAPNALDSCKSQEQNPNFSNYLDEHLEKYEEIDDETILEKESKTQTIVPEKQQVKDSQEESLNLKVMTEKLQEDSKNLYPTKNIAKRFHEENLRHKPLPDVIDDPVYKALTSGNKPHPGGSLNVQSMPSAIGWKCYSVPGPTECSKLKVYRPKTALDKIKLKKDERPKTSGAKDEIKKRFLPIDLAICWDLKPEDPSDEPKRSPHIDGSNGCAAPAVFTMVQPKETSDELNSLSSCHAITQKISKGIEEDNLANVPSQVNGKIKSPLLSTVNKEAIMSCIKSAPQQNQNDSPASTNSISTNAADYARQNPKTAWSSEDTSKALSNKLLHLQETTKRQSSNEEEKQNVNQWDYKPIQMDKKKHHQSTPNLVAACEGSRCGTEKSSSSSSKISRSSKNRSLVSLNAINGESDTKLDKKSKVCKNAQKGRNCSACEKPNSVLDENREKSEFKMAFKAGVPKSESSPSGSASVAKPYKAPKMRLPYAKKSYSIGTLVPPFSLWPESNGQEYPEHWRLASVYQHSYKPINTRKRPMLASVYQ